MALPELNFDHLRPDYWDGHFVGGACQDAGPDTSSAMPSRMGVGFMKKALAEHLSVHGNGFAYQTFGNGHTFDPAAFAIGTVVRMEHEVLGGQGPGMAQYARTGGAFDILLPSRLMQGENETIVSYDGPYEGVVIYRQTNILGVVTPSRKHGSTLYCVDGTIDDAGNGEYVLSGALTSLIGERRVGVTQHDIKGSVESLRRIRKLDVIHNPRPRSGKRRRVWNLGAQLALRSAYGYGSISQ